MKYSLCFLLLLLSCSQTRNSDSVVETETPASIPFFDLNASMSRSYPDTFTWNSIAKEIQIIPLETTNKSLLGSTSIIEVNDSFMIIVDGKTNKIHLFDYPSGKHTLQISKRGQGPGEYIYLTSVRYDKKKNMLTVLDNNYPKLIEYTMEGTYLRETLFTEKVRPTASLAYSAPEGIGIFRLDLDSDYHIGIFDEDMNVLATYFPLDSSLNKGGRAASFIGMSYTHTRAKHTIFNSMCEDTVYAVSEKGCFPELIINKGKYRYKKENLETFLRFLKENEFIGWLSVDNIHDKYVFKFLYKNIGYFDIWDKKTQQLLSRKTREQSQQDINGFEYILNSGNSIYIYPQIITENRLYFVVPAELLMDDVKGINEDSNPVILIMEI